MGKTTDNKGTLPDELIAAAMATQPGDSKETMAKASGKGEVAPKQEGKAKADGGKTEKPKAEKQKDKEEKEKTAQPATFRDLVEERTKEDESHSNVVPTLTKILYGDILYTSFIRKQIGVLLLITFFIIIYISNRYNCQQDLIEIDRLTKELKDAKYKALSSSSQLTEKSRESRVLEMLRTTNDSTLHMPNQPPYIINVPEQ